MITELVSGCSVQIDLKNTSDRNIEIKSNQNILELNSSSVGMAKAALRAMSELNLFGSQIKLNAGYGVSGLIQNLQINYKDLRNPKALFTVGSS